MEPALMENYFNVRLSTSFFNLSLTLSLLKVDAKLKLKLKTSATLTWQAVK